MFVENQQRTIKAPCLRQAGIGAKYQFRIEIINKEKIY